MVDTADLKNFVVLIVLVGMILGIGILTMDKFGDAVKDTASYNDTSVNLASSRAANGNMTAAELSLTFDEVTLTSFAIVDESNYTLYTLTENVDFTVESDTGQIIVIDTDAWFNTGDGREGNTTEIHYTYLTDSTSSDSADDVVSAMTPIGSTWIPLIITVLVLAIILGIVIKSFGGQSR